MFFVYFYCLLMEAVCSICTQLMNFNGHADYIFFLFFLLIFFLFVFFLWGGPETRALRDADCQPLTVN